MNDDRQWRLQCVLVLSACLVWAGLPADAAETLPGARELTPHNSAQRPIHVDEYTEQGLLPGSWVVDGRVERITSDHIEVDIGHPQTLYLPLKMARDRGFTVNPGDMLEIVMNDHYAVVDYHPENGTRSHRVIHGRLAEPPTVGMDKVTIRSKRGDESFLVASRARAKIEAIPLETGALFLVDEAGEIADAQLLSEASMRASADNQKPPVLGAHRRVEAIFLGRPKPERLRVRTTSDGKERILPFRPPLQKLDLLQENEAVTLLMDGEGYIAELAVTEMPPRPGSSQR